MRDVIYISFGTGLIYIANIIIKILTARIFHVTGLGELTAILLWPMIFSRLGDLGISNSLIYLTSSEPERRDDILSSSLFITCILAIVLDIIGYFLLPFLMASFPPQIVYTARIYLVICLPITMVATNLSASVQGRGMFLQFSFLRPVLDISLALGTIIFWFTGNTSLSQYLSLALCTVSLNTLLLCTLVVKEKWSFHYPNIIYIRKILSYGLRTHLGTITSMANLRLDQMLISVLLGPKLLGLYVAAVTLASISFIPSQVISMFGYPKISAKWESDEKRKLIENLFHFTLLFCLPLSLFIIWFAPGIIAFTYGSSYIGGVTPLRVLLVGSLILAIKLQLEIAYKASNKPIIPSYAEVLSVLVTMFGLWVTLPSFQIIGASITSSVAYLVSFLFMIIAAPSHINIKPQTLFSPFVTYLYFLIKFRSSIRKRLRILAL